MGVKEKIGANTQILVIEYCSGNEHLKIIYDIWTCAEEPQKLNDEPIERVISNSELFDLKRREAIKVLSKREGGAKETYEDIDHYIEENDGIFTSRKAFLSEFNKVLKTIFGENAAVPDDKQ